MINATIRNLVILLLLVLLPACASQEEGQSGGTVTALSDPADALSEELMLTLSQAKNFHHKANVLLSDGKLEESAAQVEQILAIDFPANSPEAEDVLLDARARLAQMRLQQGKLVAAMKLLDEGLSIQSRESFFVANLHTVRGEVLEAQAALAEEGSDASRRAKIDAIRAFDASIQINNKLLQKLKTKNN